MRRLARANETIKDKDNNTIIKSGEYYTLLDIVEDSLVIIDEMNTTCIMKKECFCSIMEG